MKRFLLLLALLLPVSVMGQAISWRAFSTDFFRSNNFTMNIKSNAQTWGITNTGNMDVSGNLTAGSFAIKTNLYGNTVNVNFLYSVVTTNLAGNLTFNSGLLNFNPTNYNDIVFHCYGDGANRTVAAPTEWGTTRAAHVVTNGQWSWILISAQIGISTNMAQIDFPN